ncbi:MAG: hypothetical protein ACI9YT_002300 [Halobacteriales archaeon]
MTAAVTAATSDGDVTGDQPVIPFGVSDRAYGSLDRFDHPVPSFLAAGLAVATDAPVSVTVTDAEDDRCDYLATCRIQSLDAESN